MNIDYSALFGDALKTIITIVISQALLYFISKFTSFLETRRLKYISKKQQVILGVEKIEVRKYSKKTNSANERKDAIDFLKNDLPQILENENKRDISQNLIFDKVLTIRNLVIFGVFFLAVQLISFFQGWGINQLLSAIIIASEIILFFYGIVLSVVNIFNKNKHYKKQLKEINKALLLALGSETVINLFDLISYWFKENSKPSPESIQKILASIGVVISKEELMRVTFAYINRNKNTEEKISIVSKILGESTGDINQYMALAEDERKEVETLMLNDYFDNPYSKVNIISLQ